jgi:hypothetical protein
MSICVWNGNFSKLNTYKKLGIVEPLSRMIVDLFDVLDHL